MVRNILQKHISKTIVALGFPEQEIVLEHPSILEHGDYATNIALRLKNEEYRNPRDIAQKVVDELEKDEELKKIVFKIQVAGPGFINFWLSKDYLVSTTNRITNKIEFPVFHFGPEKRILVEFAHFNTHKAVHIGHLRNIALGESLCRILETLGNTLIRTSYGGDVGMHIAKCLYGLKLLGSNKPESLEARVNLLAKAYAAGHNAFEDDEKAKQEIIDINKKIYQEDPEVMDLWKETRQWSFDQFDSLYKRVNTKFDNLYYESQVFKRGLELSQEALQKGILIESEGAVIFKGETYGLDTRVFITAEGNPTYEGKELGISEKEFTENGKLDKVIHVVAPEQTSFFKVTFKVQELLNPELFGNKQHHFAYGYVRLTEGKMSSRKGTIIQAEWLMNEVKKKIQEAFPDMDADSVEAVAVGATKYSFLKIDAGQDISFDINQSVSLEGNSGPYIQYTYARSQSLLQKAGSQIHELSTDYEMKDEELSLLRTFYKYPEVVFEAGQNFAPNLIANYLYDVAQKYNLFYQKIQILSSSEKEKEFRLSLTSAAAQVLRNGLTLLGIPVLEKM